MARFAQEHEVTLHRHGGFGRPPKPMDARAEALFGFVRQCGADLGLSIAWRDTGGVCDGNTIPACGVPVVDTMGVGAGSPGLAPGPPPPWSRTGLSSAPPRSRVT